MAAETAPVVVAAVLSRGGLAAKAWAIVADKACIECLALRCGRDAVGVAEGTADKGLGRTTAIGRKELARLEEAESRFSRW